MLKAINISKQFPGVKALDNVCLDFYEGKVNAILGENGAGKSTLLKILSGVYTQFEGDIQLKGNSVKFGSVREAQDAGIAIIHQELNLIPHLSITENLFLGREISNDFGILNSSKMNEETKAVLKRLDLDVSPNTLVNKLKIGEQQLVEIAKALLTNAEYIFMDEPTSALSDREIENLHRIIGNLKKENKTIVYISHKMDELFRIADYFTVLRDGCTISAGEMASSTEEQLVRDMVGRDVNIVAKENIISSEEVIMKLESLFLKHPTLKGQYLLSDVSFELRKGEILGFFGLMGAGRTELLETIFGLNAGKSTYTLSVDGANTVVKSPKDAIAKGIAFVTEDRKKEGLVLGMDISENISLTQLAGFDLLNAVTESGIAKRFIKSLKIKTPSEKEKCQNLSGGNQQKVVLAKWMVTNPKILFLDEPTRGIDINAKKEIYDLIKEMAKTGLSVVLVSSEIPEILTLSDRILVMADGKINAAFSASEATEDLLLKAAI